MIADIATGHSATADVLLLIAAVVFGVVFVVQLLAARTTVPAGPLSPALVPAGLALVAVALLIL